MSFASRLWPGALAGPLLLAGCSMSVPMLGADEPAITGSITARLEVQKPLPGTLAHSDAAKIGQAAATDLWQTEGGEGAEWVNAATGSSGTVQTDAATGAAAGAEPCGAFDTIVTSIGGVHRYSGRVCKAADGGSVVVIDALDKASS